MDHLSLLVHTPVGIYHKQGILLKIMFQNLILSVRCLVLNIICFAGQQKIALYHDFSIEEHCTSTVSQHKP